MSTQAQLIEEQRIAQQKRTLNEQIADIDREIDDTFSAVTATKYPDVALRLIQHLTSLQKARGKMLEEEKFFGE